ncbi:MAG: hypothetical protein JW939_10075, partial [Candidatus Thermoplasmatota archaeon]|nr:hypothetical protein [Candidatus Thermoplasmatota archaeon]
SQGPYAGLQQQPGPVGPSPTLPGTPEEPVRGQVSWESDNIDALAEGSSEQDMTGDPPSGEQNIQSASQGEKTFRMGPPPSPPQLD